jgi:hypothetical protein
VALAELDAGERAVAGAHRSRGRGEAVVVEGLDERGDPVGRLLPRRGEAVGIPLLEGGDAVLGELVHGGLTHGAAQEAECVAGEVVVVADEGPVATLGEHPRPRRAAATARTGGLAGLDEPVGVQGVDLAADGGLGEAEPLDEGRDAHRALLAHDAEHPVARARLQGVGSGINHTPMLGNCRGRVQGRVT